MIRKNVIAIEKFSAAFPWYRCISDWALNFLSIHRQDAMTGRHPERLHTQATSNILKIKYGAELLTSACVVYKEKEADGEWNFCELALEMIDPK